MNETEGRVLRIDGDHVWVEAREVASPCGACARKEGCRTQANGTGKLLRFPNNIHARPGDAVLIRAEKGLVLKSVWSAYGIPLLLGLAGAMAALEFTGSEMAAVVGVLLGLGCGFFLLRIRRLDCPDAAPMLSIALKNPD